MIKKYTILCIMIGCLNTLWGQSLYPISGKVLDSVTQTPIIGVTISVLHKKSSELTSKYGNFLVNANIGDTLVVTHVSYKTQMVPIFNNTAPLEIQLVTLNSLLDEVTISTGYQQLKPNETNGSYVVIDNKTFNQQTGTNILQRLNGVTSSLLFNIDKHNNNPQNNTNISIRGLSTINGPLDPLIVVDNFIYDGDINNINPNDVESVTILKDAAAASIWGARAGNGVIVITTKKGRLNQKIQISLNSNVIVTGKPDLYYKAQISSSDYIDYHQILFNEGYFDDRFIDYHHPVISPALQIFEDAKNGLISKSDSASQINAFKQIDSRDLFTRYYYRHGVTQQYSLNLRGGSDNLAWLIAGNYNNQINVLRSTSHKANLRFENTYIPVKNLSVNAGIYYTNNTSGSGLPTYNDVTTLDFTRQIPYLNIAGVGGASITVPHNYNVQFIDTAGGGKLLNWRYYPLTDYKHSYVTTNTEEILAHIGINYKIGRGLNASFQYQYQKQRVETSNLSDTLSYYARNLINKFSQIDPITGIVSYGVPVGGILYNTHQELNSYNLRGQINFNRSFQMHRIIALAGMEVRSQWTTGGAVNYYGYNDNPLTYVTDLNYVDYIPTYLGDYEIIGNRTSLSPQTDNRFVSFFANASYIYKSRYTLSASMRRDGSNIFGANINDKWKPLWSAGFGWEMSKEKFYHIEWLPFLKFSATYGVSGNVDLTKTALPVGITNVARLNNLRYIEINQINNPDLSWERSYQTNFKLDFGLKRNMVNGSIEYYHKRGTDLYAPTPYDYTTWGYSSTITANVADMSTNGVDIILHTNNINRSFKWKTDFLLNYNTTKTTAYYTTTATQTATFIGQGNVINPIIGKPLYGVAAYKWGGLDANGNPQGYLNDTLSNDYSAIQQGAYNYGLKGGSFVYIGPASPTYFGSLSNGFSYKGFDFSFNIIYKFHYYLFKPSLSYTALANRGSNGVNYDKRWQKSGDEMKTNIPSFVYPLDGFRDQFYAASEVNVIKGDQIRLQYVNFSYSFIANKKRFPLNLQIYFNAANLGIIWRANHDHIDPDYINSIPAPKAYTLGIRARF